MTTYRRHDPHEKRHKYAYVDDTKVGRTRPLGSPNEVEHVPAYQPAAPSAPGEEFDEEDSSSSSGGSSSAGALPRDPAYDFTRKPVRSNLTTGVTIGAAASGRKKNAFAPFMKVVAALVVGLVVLLIYQSYSEYEVNGRVKHREWSRSVEWERIETVRRESPDTMPSGAVFVRRELRPESRADVEVEYRTECRIEVFEEYVRTEEDCDDFGNCDRRDIYEPREREVCEQIPIEHVYETVEMREWFIYEVDEWIAQPAYTKRSADADHSPEWPQVPHFRDFERETRRTQRFVVEFSDRNGDTYKLTGDSPTMSGFDYKRYKIGTPWRLLVNGFGNVKSCSPRDA